MDIINLTFKPEVIANDLSDQAAVIVIEKMKKLAKRDVDLLTKKGPEALKEQTSLIERLCEHESDEIHTLLMLVCTRWEAGPQEPDDEHVNLREQILNLQLQQAYNIMFARQEAITLNTTEDEEITAAEEAAEQVAFNYLKQAFYDSCMRFAKGLGRPVAMLESLARKRQSLQTEPLPVQPD